MEGSPWNKASVLNTKIAAGRALAGRVEQNGIQGDHFIPRDKSPSALEALAQVARSSSTAALLSRDWTSTNKVAYGGHSNNNSPARTFDNATAGF